MNINGSRNHSIGWKPGLIETSTVLLLMSLLTLFVVNFISDITRENLSSVEQLSRAAQSLSIQAEELSAMVGAFKV